jgi:hypothetical protein
LQHFKLRKLAGERGRRGGGFALHRQHTKHSRSVLLVLLIFVFVPKERSRREEVSAAAVHRQL